VNAPSNIFWLFGKPAAIIYAAKDARRNLLCGKG